MNDTVLFSFNSGDVEYQHKLSLHPNPNSFAFKLHSHNTHEIYYFHKGDAAFTVEGATYPLKAGTLILSESGQVHHLTVKNADAPYERTVFTLSVDSFSPSVFEKIVRDDSGNRVFYLNEREQVWFEESCSAIEKGGFSMTALSALTQVIIAKLSTVSSSHCSEQKNDTVGQIVKYINANLTSRLSLEALEREFYRDKAHINRVFKSVMGCSIWEYIIQKRVFYARTVLYNTRSVSEAFAKSGFADYSVFYRNYVKCTGASPSADLKAFTKEEKK